MREFVPRADELAVVAAVDTIAEQRSQRLIDGAVVFDRQIGNAAPCIELPRGRDGRGGAGWDAGLASAAMGARTRINR